jgi:hypothetical protein
MAFNVGGCAAAGADESSPTEDAETQQGAVTVNSCNAAEIRWVSPVSALEYLVRGFNWIDANVPYSQSSTCTYPAGDCVGPEHWRKDCSGYTSMVWDINPNSGWSTADFASGTAVDNLGGWSELTPGDALLVYNTSEHHVMIFGGFIAGSGGSEFCVLQEHSGGADLSRYAKSDCSDGCGVHFSDFNPKRHTGYRPSGFTGSLESDTTSSQWAKCADMASGNAVEWDCNGGANQQWVAAGAAGWGTTAQIENQDTGRCLSPQTVSGGSMVNDVACDDAVVKQRWDLSQLRLKVGTEGCLRVDTAPREIRAVSCDTMPKPREQRWF